jgi:hypothetical protein
MNLVRHLYRFSFYLHKSLSRSPLTEERWRFCTLRGPLRHLNFVDATLATIQPDLARLSESRSLTTSLRGFPIGVLAGVLPKITVLTVCAVRGGNFAEFLDLLPLARVGAMSLLQNTLFEYVWDFFLDWFFVLTETLY